MKILYGDRVGRMQGVKASQKHRWMLIEEAGSRTRWVTVHDVKISLLFGSDEAGPGLDLQPV